MEKESTIKKQPVLGKLSLIFKLAFYVCALVCTVIFIWLAVKFEDMRKLYLILMCSFDIVLLLLSYIIPTLSFYENYSYALSAESITLYRKDEKVMEMKWPETDVSLGSYINKGTERKPAVCVKAICFTHTGKMRQPARFPKRALKGAGGELCIAFSKARLKDVYNACGGKVMGNISADGCRLSMQDTELMESCLEKLKAKAPKKTEGSKPKDANTEENEKTPSL